MKDYFQILGVKWDSPYSEVKQAYRRLALQWHPDINSSPNAQEKFVELGMAYEVLKDPVKRARYLALYRVQFRQETPRRPERYQKHHVRWQSKVKRAEERGRQRSEKAAHRPPSSRTDFTGSWHTPDVEDVLWGIILRIFFGRWYW